MSAAIEFRDVSYEAAGRRLLDGVSLALEERHGDGHAGAQRRGKDHAAADGEPLD